MVMTATSVDALGVLGVVLGGAIAGLAPAMLLLWAAGLLELPRRRSRARGPLPASPPAFVTAPIAPGRSELAALPPTLPAPTTAAPALGADPGASLRAPHPAATPEVPAGHGDDPAAGRHPELYEYEYTRELDRLDARWARISADMRPSAVDDRQGYQHGRRQAPKE
jgi:hypothetical protein